jgi:hypothetical protein
MVLFENALRDGAAIERVESTRAISRYRLVFPNGDDLVADVLTVWKDPVLFVCKAIRARGDDRPDLDRFMASLD